MGLSIEEVETDYWAHHYYDHPVSDAHEADDWDTDSIVDMMESGEWEEVFNERN